MRQLFIIALSLFCIPFSISAQQSSRLEGKVSDGIENTPLVGAKLFWLGTQKGTNTDQEGAFSLRKTAASNQLVVSFFGYSNDTILIGTQSFVEIRMQPDLTLDAVEIEGRKRATSISFLDPLKTENIGEKEIEKAACCNLSESFETNPSVDVAFTDAVTGTRQIQLLGLAGPYTQITRENMPHIRGLSSLYGLTYTPGFWVESIQLSKGAGSVANGYESIAGQINVELRKPEEADRFALNLYANEGGRLEANLNLAHKFEGGKWSTGLLLHGANRSAERDRNGDNFLDNPLNNTVIALNRWKYFGSNGLRIQLGIKGTYIDRFGGQLGASEDPTLWGMQLNTRRLEGFAKIGKILPKAGHSMGLQLSAATHEQDSYFGLREYDANQQTAYANFAYQGILGTTNHVFKTGLSFQYDRYAERLESTNYDRVEVVPGAYGEYTYNYLDKLGIVAGLRVDYHNLFGAFVTPRLHIRYAILEKTILRASAGRGQRTANILSENNGLLASNREFVIQGDGDNSDKPFGLDQEVAWNYGLNLTQLFTLDYREGTFSLDFYRTDFVNQIVIDLDQNPRQVVFYNLDGQSYSNSFQAQFDYELIKRLDVRLAYRWFDVKTTYDGKLRQKPLVSTHRAFVNLAYETRNYWKFDYTVNWQSSKRLPFTSANPERYRLEQLSPAFFIMNAQISKTWLEKFDVYLGGENLLNFIQEDPILGSDQPFSPYFDSSLVWGPIFGRNIYMGLRYNIK
ncbi:MAG: TonB-dependent receptor [Bacteroidia bacterium]